MENKIVIICAIAIISIGLFADAGFLNTETPAGVNVSNVRGVNRNTYPTTGYVVPTCNPTLLLPTEPVTANAVYTTDTYFKITLSNVPTDKDYNVANGTYTGWCAQADILMDRGVNISVHLYSSYDPNMPDAFKSCDWSLINYLINHRAGYTRMEVQNVIWYILGYDPYIQSGSPAETLLADVLTNGAGFCPQPCDRFAILCDKVTTDPATFQRCFFEIQLPCITVCTRTQGYWRNHPDAWPVENITIGNVTYTKAQAIEIMDHNSKKDMTYQMFQQLVATKLNLIRGTASGCLNDTVDLADQWMEDYPVGSGVTGDSEAWTIGEPLKDILDDYNNGLLCAPHCSD